MGPLQAQANAEEEIPLGAASGTGYDACRNDRPILYNDPSESAGRRRQTSRNQAGRHGERLLWGICGEFL